MAKSMLRVLIFGAGSIGNHLAHACRQKDWHVEMVDIDPGALNRTRDEIYPGRYGEWDDSIVLRQEMDAAIPYDLVIVGTPPDSHLGIALDVLAANPPKVMLIEKPLCSPNLEGLSELEKKVEETGCICMVAYNHNFTDNTEEALRLIRSGFLGQPRSMHVRWLEHWGGIFNAHPWLEGPWDSYLGYSTQGGGACAEHSHAISLWELFASALGSGKVTQVSALMDVNVSRGMKYDRTTQISLKTGSGLIGTVTQDVVTSPAEKSVRIQGDDGFIEWYANFDADSDALIYGEIDQEPVKKSFPKTRPDDFRNQISVVGDVLAGRILPDRNILSAGVETMKIVAAAHQSYATKKVVLIDL